MLFSLSQQQLFSRARGLCPLPHAYMVLRITVGEMSIHARVVQFSVSVFHLFSVVFLTTISCCECEGPVAPPGLVGCAGPRDTHPLNQAFCRRGTWGMYPISRVPSYRRRGTPLSRCASVRDLHPLPRVSVLSTSWDACVQLGICRRTSVWGVYPLPFAIDCTEPRDAHPGA